LKGVIARAEQDGVIPAPAGDDIVAISAEDGVSSITAGDRVIPRASVHRELNQGREPIAASECIVPAVHIDHEAFGRADIDAERRRRGIAGGGRAVP